MNKMTPEQWRQVFELLDTALDLGARRTRNRAAVRGNQSGGDELAREAAAQLREALGLEHPETRRVLARVSR